MKRLLKLALAFMLASALVAPLVGCDTSTSPPMTSGYSAPTAAAPAPAPKAKPKPKAKAKPKAQPKAQPLDPNYYSSPPPGANPSPDSKGYNDQWHQVQGYTRADGTYVAPYYRRTKRSSSSGSSGFGSGGFGSGGFGSP